MKFIQMIVRPSKLPLGQKYFYASTKFWPIEMPDTPNPLSDLLAASALSLRSEWSALVALAAKLSKDKEEVRQVAAKLAAISKSSEDSIARKIFAIQGLQTQGLPEEMIVNMGQTLALSTFQKSKEKEKRDVLTNLTFKIPGAQREQVREEIARVMRVLDLHSSERLWEFLIAQLQSASDEELLHAAGEKK